MLSEAKCTICGKPQEPRLAPFCSKRCADIDLGRWLKGGYAIPGTPTEGNGDPSPPGDTAKELPDGE